MKSRCPARWALTVAIAAALAIPSLTSAQVTEVWQTRVLETVEKMGEIEEEFAPSRERLAVQREEALKDAQQLRESIKGRSDQATRQCVKRESAECLDARAHAQQSHLDLTENVKDRLAIEARIVNQNFDYSLKLSDVLAAVLDDLRQHAAKAEARNDPHVDTIELRTRRFMKKALPALQSAARYADAVARGSGSRAKARGARDLIIAVSKFRREFEGDSGQRGPIERLAILQARFESFAAINRQARHALHSNAQHLRAINALAATSLAENMIAHYEGGLAKYGRKFAADTEQALHAFRDDIDLLYEGVGGSASDTGTEGFFEDSDSIFFDE